MSSHDGTRAVLLTPAGRGALASVLVEGLSATSIVGELFFAANKRPLVDQTCGRILFGRWQSPLEGEEIVVCRRDRDRIEIHCHGGHAAVAALMSSLCDRGCRVASWQQWLATANSDGRAVDALIALASVATERTAAILWDQSTGALSDALRAISGKIETGKLDRALAEVARLLEWSTLGCHLIEPWKVVLAGQPNVGKSSLINALVGYERAIVHETPGTTRDVVTATTAIDGWPVQLADTAGLRASDDTLEALGIQLAEDCVAAADLVVLVFDASRSWSTADAALLAGRSGVLVVHNKCDLTGAETGRARPEGLFVSALTGEGIEDLQSAISLRLVPNCPAAGVAVPFTSEQVESLRQVRAALEARNRLAAVRSLAPLLA